MKILIVDDNSNERKLLRLNLEHHGIETVVEAADGQEGLERSKAERPDIVISDGLMPKMDGFQLLRRMRADETLKSIPFIFYSAIYTGDQEIELATSIGAEAFIVKPLGPEEFWNELKGILERQRLVAEKTATGQFGKEEGAFLREYSQVVTLKLEEKVQELTREIEERKKAEEKIRQLASIVECTDDAIIGQSPDGTVLSWNKGAETIYGYREDEMIGSSISALSPPDAPDDIPRILEHIRSGEHLDHYETRRMRKDGAVIHVSLTVSPVKDAAGRVVGVSTIARDITDRKDAQNRTKVLNDLIQLFAGTFTRKTYLDVATNVIQHWSGCRNVGIRIKDADNNIPFESCTGYNEEFLDSEGTLSLAHDRCICTRVVAGTPDPLEIPAMTPYGSFHHNNSLHLIAGFSKDELARFRGACMRHGYKSLAVIPIRYRDKTIGAIHLADEAADMVPLKHVDFLEQAAHVIGEAMFRFDMEDDLRQVSAYNRNLIESSLDPLVTIGPDGRITDVNAATEAVTGFARAELIGTDFSDYFTEPELAKSGYEKAFREGSVKDYPLEIRHRDGHTTLVVYNASVYRDETGAVSGVFAAARDVTERMRMEEDMRRFSAYNRSLIESSMDPLVTIGPDGRITDVNAATEAVTGFSRAELIGTDFSNYFTEPELAKSGYRLAFREGSVRDYPLAIRRRDGQVTLVLYNASVYRDETGAVIGVFAAARDITARTRMEDSLQEQKWFAESLIANSAVATFVLNPQHEIVLWNKACEELTGFKAGEMIGGSDQWKPFYDRKRPTLADVIIDGATDRLDELYGVWGKSLFSKKGLRAEGWFRNLNGKNRYLLFEAVPIYSSKRQLTVVLEIMFDFTDRKQSENDLKKLNRTLMTLSASNMTLIHAQEEAQLLQDICRIVVEVGKYSMVWVGYAEQTDGKTIWPMAHAGRDEGYLEALPLTCDGSCDCPAARAIRVGETVITQNISAVPGDAAWRTEAVTRRFASCIALPLRMNNRVIGALNIYAAEENAFTDDEIKLLSEMAGDLSYGIMSLRTKKERDRAVEERQIDLEKLRLAMEDTIQAMGAMLEMRDPYLSGHQERVAFLAVSIATEMGLTKHRIDGIHFGSVIHDIGKIAVPAEFLNRPGKLTEMEYNYIKIHPQRGYEIVKDIEFPWPVAQMIRQHHENMDGSGYPQGLKRDEIVLEARILQVADVVEAMATHRPYRPARGIEVALAEISAKRGILYDPDVVDACMRLFREKGFTLS